MRANKFLITCCVPLLALIGCEKNPIDRLTNPVPEGQSDQVSGNYMIYSNGELFTLGGLGFIPGGENQSIDLRDSNSPMINGKQQLRYHWNGQDVRDFNNGNTLQHLFAGFSLLITPNFDTLTNAQPKAMSGHGYGTIKFSARGSLASDTTLKVDGPGNGDANQVHATTPLTITTLSSSWQDYSMTIGASDLTAVKSFITFSFQYAQPSGTTVAGGGGTVYLQNIRYEP